jgi:hypothetical protein
VAVRPERAASVDRLAPADSVAAPRVRVRPGQARRAPALAPATTTAGRPGATVTKVTADRPAATATMAADHRGAVRRLVRVVMLATTTVRLSVDRDRSATCCTAATPSSKHSEPAARFAA